MKNLLKFVVAVGLVVLVQSAWAQLEVGKVSSKITLQDKLGGRLDGTPWNSEELLNKVSVIFYVDPDERDLNNEVSETLKSEGLPEDKFQSYAIINMAATWLPNFVISNILEEKQKHYRTTIYVRDYKKVLVKEWGLSDHNSDVLAFDASGKLFFRKDGKLNEEDIKNLLTGIHAKLDTVIKPLAQ